jgi:PAS domain S-box-containing protein
MGVGLRSTSAELIDTLLALMPDAAVVVDRSGTITHGNESLSTLFGYEPAALIGQPIEALVPQHLRGTHRDHRSRFAENPHPRAMGAGLQLSGLRRDGSEFPLDISLAPLRVDDDVATVASIRDVSDRVAIEVELRRLLAEGARHARWQEITAELRLRILDGASIDEVLQLSVERLDELAGATGVVAFVGDPPQVAASSSLEPGRFEAIDLADLPVAAGDAPELRRRQALAPTIADAVGAHDILILPIGAGEDRAGSLICLVDDEPDAPAIDLALSFAEQVALAIQLDRARRERDELLIGDERGRIARDLHDVVIQRLFASGLSVQSVLPAVRDERVADRLVEVVDELDATIREIRTTIFTLAPPARSSSGLRAQVLELIDESSRSLGFEATARFRGPIDTATPPTEATAVLAVVREALANVARHARASTARIEISASDGIEVVVVDDGVGIPDDRRESGLRNLRERAEELGGSFAVTPGDSGGTVLRWQIPVARVRT